MESILSVYNMIIYHCHLMENGNIQFEMLLLYKNLGTRQSNTQCRAIEPHSDRQTENQTDYDHHLFHNLCLSPFITSVIYMYINYYLRQEKNHFMIFILALQFDYLNFSIFSLMFLAEKKKPTNFNKTGGQIPTYEFPV